MSTEEADDTTPKVYRGRVYRKLSEDEKEERWRKIQEKYGDQQRDWSRKGGRKGGPETHKRHPEQLRENGRKTQQKALENPEIFKESGRKRGLARWGKKP